MSDRLQVFPATSPAWEKYIQRTAHDFHFSAAYHRFLESQGCGEPWVAVFGSEDRFLVWPYLVRAVDGTFAAGDAGATDLGSADGYAGPLACGCRPGDPFLVRGWQALVAYWLASGVVSVFCRFHPLLENHRLFEGLPAAGADGAPPSGESVGGIKLEGRTISVDLSLSDEQSWQQYRETHRRHINRGRRLGLISSVDYEFENLAEFVRLYNATMRHNHAAAQYLHTVSFMQALRQALAPSLFLHVAYLGPRLAAAALVTEYHGIVQYLFGAVEEELYCISPLKLLLEDIRKWSRARGNRVFHLGGGRGGHEDSLFHFKAGFSRRSHPFYTGRWVLAPDRYQWLSEQRRRRVQGTGQTVDPTFFPAYRAPLIEAKPAQEQAVPATASAGSVSG